MFVCFVTVFSSLFLFGSGHNSIEQYVQCTSARIYTEKGNERGRTNERTGKNGRKSETQCLERQCESIGGSAAKLYTYTHSHKHARITYREEKSVLCRISTHDQFCTTARTTIATVVKINRHTFIPCHWPCAYANMCLISPQLSSSEGPFVWDMKKGG